MQTYRLKVDPDGKVAIPDAEPGQTLIIQVDVTANPDYLTLATARTPEEKELVIERILELGRQVRESMGDDVSFDHNDLYDEDGLPA